MPPAFNDYNDQFLELVSIYEKSKSMILFSEEIDPSAKSNIQIIKELRDAFDHLMRVVSAITRTSPEKGDRYCRLNLDKSRGHVYRAAFDAVDGAAISLRLRIKALLSGYPQEVLADVLPDYWDIYKYLNESTKRFAAYRTQKDVGHDLGTVFDSYSRDLDKLKNIADRIVAYGSALDARCTVYKKKDLRNVWFAVLSAFLGFGLSAAMFLFTDLLSK